MLLYEKSIETTGKEKEVLKQLYNFRNENKEIIVQTFTRHFTSKFSCIDHLEKPIKLNNFWVSGSLIYIKSGFNYRTISFDDIQKIEIN